MRTSYLLTLGFSTLTLLDGVAAQRNGKTGQGASTATTTTASAATASTSSGADTASAASSSASAAKAGGGTSGATLIGGGQPNSNSDGNPTAGQAPSLTDPDNFINFCQGKTATNGLQNTAGSCNPIPMGDLPAKTKMISTVITSPQNGANAAAANTAFNIKLTSTNLQAGQFTNPNVAYYTAPQHLNAQGEIIGHVHVTVQDMGSDINNPTPPDPTTFAFFKGIDDAGDGKGNLQAVVTAGLPAGNYRICTMVAAANHQPVMMPVAQRGAQDDCIRVTIGGEGSASSSAGTEAATSTTSSKGKGGGASTSAASTTAAAGGAKAIKGGGATASSSSSATSSAALSGTSAAPSAAPAVPAAPAAPAAPASPAAPAAPSSGTGRGGRGGSNRSVRRSYPEGGEVVRGRFVAREFIV